MGSLGKDLLRRWWPRSLRARQLIASSFGLLAFLVLTGITLEQAFTHVASQGQHERLREQAMAYAGSIEFARDGTLIPPAFYPDPRYELPNSGLYVQVVVDDDEVWSAPSSRGPQLPEGDLLDGSQELFQGPLPMQHSTGERGEIYRFGLGLYWEVAQGHEIPYTIYVMEDAGTLPRQVRVFRGAMWMYFALSALVLLGLQALVQRWTLLPLQKIEAELKKVQFGQSKYMSDAHPRELAPLTQSINALIASERGNLERQRNTLADLAHSLKTPLAVLRARLDSDATLDELRQDLDTQLRRMNDLVGYQLARAASGGHTLFAAPQEISSHAEQIVVGLEKIYAQKGVLCEFEIDEKARFFGELGDLQELLGNLLENAFKWAKNRVLLTVQIHQASAGQRPGLLLAVDDDGPGIADENIAHVLQRGVRGDERVQGHGIGLAIVQDIVHSYQGQLYVSRSQALGGARFEVRLPPV